MLIITLILTMLLIAFSMAAFLVGERKLGVVMFIINVFMLMLDAALIIDYYN